VGLKAWVRYPGGVYHHTGCGFFLRIDAETIVGVVTAHSLPPFDSPLAAEGVAFQVPGQDGYVAEFDRLHGPPGVSRTGSDMTVDYVLLQVNHDPAPGLVLAPDPRGKPQPGERVILFSGLGEDGAGRRTYEGTVQSVEDTAAWVTMDERFKPGLMSGSPFVSQHTGRVVGMVIAASPRRNGLLLSMHPVGSLVRLAEAATSFPTLSPP
jgi:hypothetical protein